MKRILFVDDEPLVLQALTRMLHGVRNEWEMQFAGGGAEALKLMAENPADVVVSDMRMPGMNGAELLNEIMRRHPKTVRFILSGYADEEMVMQCVRGIHQFLSKPCNGENLRSTVRRALEMDRWMNNDRIKSMVSCMTTVSSLPALYFEILKELRSPDAALDEVGALIARDPAMTAKILQLVNSAFFGLSRPMTNPTEAVTQLGMETIKSLVLTMHVFSGFQCREDARIQVENIFHHSLATATTARRIAEVERQEKRILEEAFTGGLLHDIGRLALVANLPDQYAEARALSNAEAITLVEAERTVFGASHAEVGGYLLGLWGLPITLVETAVFHHSPSECSSANFSALTAVHAANVLAHDPLQGQNPNTLPKLDQNYLARLGVWERIPNWRSELTELELA